MGENIQWIRQFGTADFDSVGGINASAGSLYVAGTTGNGFALPGQTNLGSTDAFLRKYDSGGNEVWTREFGSTSSDSGTGVAAESAVYVIGNTNGALPGQTKSGSQDAFVCKYDSDGNAMWCSQFGGGSFTFTAANSVSTDATGVYVIGTTSGALPGASRVGGTIVSNDGDAFVRKYDPNGNVLWTREFGTAANDTATGGSVDASGVYVSGNTDGILPGQVSAGGTDAFLRKYDADGTELWTRQFGTPGFDVARKVSVQPSGAYVLGVTTGVLPGQTGSGMSDGFLRKYDSSGNVLWTRQFSTGGFGDANDVTSNASGVYVGGRTPGAFPGQSSAGDNDGYVIKYDPDGSQLWVRQFGTAGFDAVFGGVSADETSVYAAGFTQGTFPGETSAGSFDAFVLRIVEATNQAPTADAGPGQTVEATSAAGASVTLNGSGSSDPDGDTLSFTWTGPFGSTSGPNPTITLPLGTHSITLAVDDGNGGIAYDTVVISVQDTTSPDTSIIAHPNSVSSTASASFTFEGTDTVTQPAALAFECGLDSGPWVACSSPLAYSGLADGAHEFRVRAKDEAGNVDPTPAYFMWTIDTVPPAITSARTPTPNANGWNNTDVTVIFTCTDDGSGVATPPVSPQVVSTEGAGQSVSASCTDNGGNSASLTVGDINIDKTAPTINIVSPASGATFVRNSLAAANYSCNDARSGVATCTGPVANGANISTGQVGSQTFTVNATDLAGNAASLTHNYMVVYSFIGFLQPIDNLPVINQAKPGKTIPIKWQIKDAAGNFVSDLSTLTSLLSAPIACDASPTAIVEEQLTSPGSTVFRYDATANQFIYNWQSASNWKGCRLLQLTLSDGSQQWAKFNFK